MSELPEGWAAVPAGELGEWRGGGTPSKSNHAFWKAGTIPWVSPKDMKRQFISDAEDHITEAAIAGSATQRVPANSILMVTRSGILQHSLPVAINTVPVTVNQDLKTLSPFEGIVPEYILWHLQADAPRILEAASKTGTTVESINFDRLKAYPIRLAPLPEQKRIVAKVDGLTARTARARADLARIPTLIARYKQRLLATIFERLDLGGQVTHLGDMACFVTSGSRGWAQYYAESGDMFVRVGNVKRANITLDLGDVQHVKPPQSAEGLRTKLEKNDLLITITADLGRVGIFESENKAYVNQHVALVRLWEPDQAKYVAWYLSSEQGQASLHRNTRGATKAGLGLDDIREVEIPLPSLEEQVEIVRRIESAFNWLDRVAVDHAAASKLLPKLDSAILAKAFRGELVPQDPNDEPATAFLARIKAQRASSQKLVRPLRSMMPKTLEPDVSALHSDDAPMKLTKLPVGVSAMTKSRQDDDVMGKPYLASILKQRLGAATPNDLYTLSDLQLHDFYHQLAQEYDKGWLRDAGGKVEAI
jgi:type I restriction enzyme S subunit